MCSAYLIYFTNGSQVCPQSVFPVHLFWLLFVNYTCSVLLRTVVCVCVCLHSRSVKVVLVQPCFECVSVPVCVCVSV